MRGLLVPGREEMTRQKKIYREKHMGRKCFLERGETQSETPASREECREKRLDVHSFGERVCGVY